ncbi:MAG TPA: hypothetical protein VJ862_02610 [Rhodanobacteraceae bacterium]|nr:hypothetical protein [Rhodanobacteraceae bacterium]
MNEVETDHETGVPHNPDARERSDLPFPVVGLGASAGGLVALKRFLENVPKSSGLALLKLVIPAQAEIHLLF